MGPKPAVVDTEMKYCNLKIVGGEPPSNAVLSSKLSPFGVVCLFLLIFKESKKSRWRNQQKYQRIHKHQNVC